MANYTFTADNPPLLKNVGLSWVLENQEVNGPVQTYDANMSTVVYNGATIALSSLGAASPNPISATVSVQKKWKVVGMPTTTANETSETITEVFGTTVRQLNTVRALVSATVSGGFGPVSAEVSTELEMTSGNETTYTSEKSNSKTITVPAGYSYAQWELVKIITIKYNSPLTLNFGIAKPTFNLADQTAEIVLTTYQDQAPVN